MLHHHRKPLGPSPAASTRLPRDVYAALVGTIDGAIGRGNADHVLLPVRIATGEYTDLVKAGVVDPTKVTRTALQNAASISGLLLTTEALVTELPEKEKPAGGPPGGMPGMGGMDY